MHHSSIHCGASAHCARARHLAVGRVAGALFAALLPLCAAVNAVHAASEEPGLTSHQQAIADNVAKSSAKELQFSKAPTDPIGEEFKLALRQGTEVTLVRVDSTVQKD